MMRSSLYSSFIKAVYLELLGREPDPVGYDHHLNALSRGGLSVQQFMNSILLSEEFRSISIHRLLANASSAKFFSNNQSQFNEVDILLELFAAKACPTKFLVDVGARGKDRSNSWDILSQFGWAGLLIEANPNLQSLILEEFKGLNFDLVSCAVADFEGESDFTFGINDDVSSLLSEKAEAWGPTAGKTRVRVRRLSTILQEHKVPRDFGLLSLDIEGLDVDVLNDLIGQSPYRPDFVIIEASDNFRVRSITDAGLSDLVDKEYALVGQTESNLVLKKV